MPIRRNLNMDEISAVGDGMNPLADILLAKEKPGQGGFMAALRKAFGAKDDTERTAALAEAEVALGSEVEEGEQDGDGVAKGCSACKPGKPCETHAKMFRMKKEATTFIAALSQSLRWEYYSALEKAVRTHVEDEALTVEQKVAGIRAATEQFLTSVYAGAGITIAKGEKTMPDEKKPDAPANDDLLKGLPDDVRARVQKQIDDAKAAGKAEAEQAAGTTVAALEKSVATLSETVEKERAALEKERNERLAKERLDRATDLIDGAVPGITAPELAKVLGEVSEESRKVLEKAFSTTAALIKENRLFEVVGSSERDGADEKELAKSGDDLQKENPRMSRSEALRKAASAKPRQYREQDPASARRASR